MAFIVICTWLLPTGSDGQCANSSISSSGGGGGGTGSSSSNGGGNGSAPVGCAGWHLFPTAVDARGLEDPFMWMQPLPPVARGGDGGRLSGAGWRQGVGGGPTHTYHALFHDHQSYGGHAFSYDAVHWTFSSIAPYGACFVVVFVAARAVVLMVVTVVVAVVAEVLMVVAVAVVVVVVAEVLMVVAVAVVLMVVAVVVVVVAEVVAEAVVCPVAPLWPRGTHVPPRGGAGNVVNSTCRLSHLILF